MKRLQALRARQKEMATATHFKFLMAYLCYDIHLGLSLLLPQERMP
jgi:hypothetical protein